MTGKVVDCTTQEQFRAALAAGHTARVSAGLWEASASAHVEAWGSAHVVAWESAHVEAWVSAHVVARESAHVEARESAHVEAWGSAHVVASRYVTITKHGATAITEGGVLVVVPPITTAEDWCDYYGAKVTDGIATLYKVVRADYRSQHGFLYQPGTSPEAPDWDGGVAECGGGLHFCAHPIAALDFDGEATKFLACPVALADIVVHHPAGYPHKIKARRICGPIVEVDRYGKPLQPAAVSA
jgi:hypothetical protein